MQKKKAVRGKGDPKPPARRRSLSWTSAEQTIRSIFRHASLAFFTYNQEGALLFWNKALEGLLELPGETIKGKHVFDLAAKGNEKERTEGIIKAVFDGKALAGIHWEIYRAGQTRYLSISTFPMRKGTGRILFGIATLTDVTEKKRLELALLQAEKMAALGTLASGLAHEVGTPMNVILGRAESLLRHTEEEKTAKGLKIIIEQIDRMTRLIQHLLAFARRKPLEKKQVQINDVAGKVIEIAGPPARAKNISVVPDFDGALPTLRGNGDQLLQLFINLFMNAVDATPPGGKIQITTRQIRIERRRTIRDGSSPDGNTMVEILFKDTGTGIDPSHIDRVFDPFFTTKPAGKGTGLGLAVAHGIVQDHGGEIEIESAAGKGTTFHIRLPVGSAPNKISRGGAP